MNNGGGEMSRHFFLQELADAYYIYRHNPTPDNEMKALNAFIAGMAACIRRKELEQVCVVVDGITGGRNGR